MNKRNKLIITVLLFIFSSLSAAAIIKYTKRETTYSNASTLPGKWVQVRSSNTSKVDNETYERLIGLGYLQGYTPAEIMKGVTVHKKELAFQGINFFVSGHAPEAFLMDMEGNIFYTWHYKKAYEVWKDTAGEKKESQEYWRRAYLYPNGDVLAIYDGIRLIKIDKNSNLLWEYTGKRRPHHDLEVVENGDIYTLTRAERVIPRISREDAVTDEYIAVLNEHGELKREISLSDLIDDSPYATLLDRKVIKDKGFYGQIFHSNTIEVFDGTQEGKSPLFKKGNVLVSILILDAICIVDMEREKLVWFSMPGLWAKQHQPTLLKNGNMLIFDNKHDPIRQRSQVLEFNPFTQEILWEYTGSDSSPFFSGTCGSNQRLPNGNTLITETDMGRVFEVTKDKEIVWEYLNPFRAGENDNLIAVIPEMIRIEPTHYSFINNINWRSRSGNSNK